MKAASCNLPSMSRSIPCCPLSALQDTNSWSYSFFFFSSLSKNESIYANRFYYVGPGSRVSTEKTARSQEKKGHLGRLVFLLSVWSVWILLNFPDNQWSKDWSLGTARRRLCCHTFWIRQLAPIWVNFKRLTMLGSLCIKSPSIYLDISTMLLLIWEVFYSLSVSPHGWVEWNFLTLMLQGQSNPVITVDVHSFIKHVQEKQRYEDIHRRAHTQAKPAGKLARAGQLSGQVFYHSLSTYIYLSFREVPAADGESNLYRAT